jgi:UDP-N-acetylmuramate--alanine ligase
MFNIQDYKKIHFIGIGGVGMSALVKFMRHHNIRVTGSDVQESDITADLETHYDISVYIGARAENVTSEHDCVVYSPAISESNIERQEALNYNIPQYSYPEMLAKVMADSYTIAVSGTNGKTTTTSMVIETLKHLGLDPTGIIGAFLQKYNSNFVAGQSEYFVTEACEYKESFLHIHHDIAVITNITEDHLDYFKDLEHIQNTFKKFIDNKKGAGIIVCNIALPELAPIIEYAKQQGCSIVDYGKYIDDTLSLPIPGTHNLQNAAATLAVVEALNLSIAEARKYLSKNFQGVKRRMEHVGITEGGAFIFDDYAHNPEGLSYLISGVRDFYPEKKIIMLFEPHLYSRTRDFKESFAAALEEVDILYLFPTYRAREAQIPEEDFLLAEYINNSKVDMNIVTNPNQFKEDFESQEYANDYIIISAGAGDIWKQGLKLKK